MGWQSDVFVFNPKFYMIKYLKRGKMKMCHLWLQKHSLYTALFLYCIIFHIAFGPNMPGVRCFDHKNIYI